MDPRDKPPRSRQTLADNGPALLRRLPAYIYLADLWHGRRVVEIGCGDGASAAYLARSGAAQVLGLDRSPAHIDLARARQRTPNLAFAVADFDALDLEDSVADVVCVPGGAELARWPSFLDEARRVLSPDGCLIVSVTSADRGGAANGMGYHDLRSRLAPVFGDVRMVGVVPFVGFAIVEYDEAEVVDVELDTSLTPDAARDPVAEYVAIAGAELGSPRGFMLVEIPTADGLQLLGQARGAGTSDWALAERLAEAEAAAQAAQSRLAEIEAAPPRVRGEDAELKRRLTRAIEERNALEVEVLALRARLGQADEELGQVAAQAAREVNEARRQVQVSQGRGEALEAQMLELTRELETRTATLAATTRRISELEAQVARAAREPASRPKAEAQLEIMARAAAKHETEMRSRIQALAERDAYVEELQHELEEVAVAQRAAAEAARDASVRVTELESELRTLRGRLSAAEGESLRLRHASAPAGPDPRIGELEKSLAEKTNAADKLSARWKEAEGKTDELWRKIGDLQKELVASREQAVETARQQRQAAQIALTRAVDEASKKLVSAQDAGSRAEKESATLRTRMDAAAQAANERLARAESEAIAAKQRLGDSEHQVEQCRQRIAWLEVELGKPRVDPSVVGLREELDRERAERMSAEEEIRRLQRALGQVHAQMQAQAESTAPTPGTATETEMETVTPTETASATDTATASETATAAETATATATETAAEADTATDASTATGAATEAASATEADSEAPPPSSTAAAAPAPESVEPIADDHTEPFPHPNRSEET